MTINTVIIAVFLAVIAVRLLSVYFAEKNEVAQKAAGAVEYDSLNSKRLIGTHVLIYLCSAFEGFIRKPAINEITVIAIILLGLSMVALLYVMAELKEFWTLKVIISKEHQLNTSYLFRKLKHPNYFFCVIPELIGVILLFNAWMTAIPGFIVYFYLLTLRIKSEEQAMREAFPEY